LTQPKALLSVTITNQAFGSPECRVASMFNAENQSNYENDYVSLINRCYLDYLRVYKQVGATLISSTPQAVPGDMVATGQDVPAKVDALIDEGLPGISVYGTLFSLAGNETLSTTFGFQLPPSVVNLEQGVTTYTLHIQKQPGTVAIPIRIILKLPPGAVLINQETLTGEWEGGTLTINTDLRQDIDLTISFR
jgi:hypothetical protein